MNINELFGDGFIILDGGMGTMLQAKGLEIGGVPEVINITKPEWLIVPFILYKSRL